MKIENLLTTATLKEVTEFIALAMARRRDLLQMMVEVVAFTIKVLFNTTSPENKSWARCVDAIDVTKPNIYGFLGDKWLKKSGALPEGTLILIGGRREAAENVSSTFYALCRIKSDEAAEAKSSCFEFTATGVELLATSGECSPEATQKILDQYPELAPAAGNVLMPLFFEALKILDPK